MKRYQNNNISKSKQNTAKPFLSCFKPLFEASVELHFSKMWGLDQKWPISS